MTFMKIVQFSRLPSTPFSKILPPLPLWPWTSSFKQSLLPLSLQMITNQLEGLKENIIQGWLLYVIRSFLQVAFCLQYQLINYLWLSVDFFLFSWSQPCPQSYLKKAKTSFSFSSYSKKECWCQGWAEASPSVFSWLYIFVCEVVQKYHEMFFVILLVLILQSICFICTSWKRKQTKEQ